MKKRIMIISEASYIKSGYGRLTLDLCKRFSDLGKYEVAEFGHYGHIDYPLKSQLNWFHYANGPGTVWGQPPSQDEQNAYNSNLYNHFGEWRQPDSILHFKPDVLISYLDPWMLSVAQNSPYRHLYKIIYVPTIDARSLNEGWLGDYASADHVFTYTDFAYNELKKYPQINLKGVATPGVENKVFMPIANKKEHKKRFGIPENAKVVGTVMRNQKRKLYPDVFDGFVKFLQICQEKDKELGQSTYLYVHSSYPDVGWDFARLLKEYGLSHKVLFTYICTTCGAASPAFFGDATKVCPNCNNATCVMPNTNLSLDEAGLNQIYNVFDVYVQYALAEGLGMPAIEAASAGVHLVYSDYSGPEDFKKLGGSAIPIKAFYRESDTNRDFAVPDNDALAQTLFSLLSLPESMLLKKGMDARRGVLKHFNWKDTIEKLCKSVDELPTSNWASQPKVYQPNLNEPQGLTDAEFITWAILNVLGDPDKLNTYFFASLLRDLSMGISHTFNDPYQHEDSVIAMKNPTKVGRNEIKKKLLDMCNKRNEWETKRVAHLNGQYQFPAWLLKSIQK